MGKKMYYSEQEAADRLGVPAGELAAFIRDDRLRVFQDGPRRMFRVDEVEGLVSLAATQRRPEEEIVDLAPADSANLSEAEAAAPPTKEDTVITAEGISIFDDEDLEIETADPMAKTQIAPSIEDQVAMEGVGSGSGLLDLTRESDDTSLGAEVLDHIDLEPPPMAASAAGASAVAAPPISAAAAAETPIIMPTYVEAIDPGAGLFGGIVVGCAIVAALMAVAALGYVSAKPPDYVAALKENLAVVLVVAAVVIIAGAVGGYLAGKASAARQRALRQMGV